MVDAAQKLIVVTGAEGMLGKAVVEEVQRRGVHVRALSFQDLDITREADVMQIISELKPIVLINCAAYTDVDSAETDPGTCLKVNLDGVSNLLKACDAVNARLIHVSTDYVFDGSMKQYQEDAERNPLQVYGESKAKSEDVVLPRHTVVRTSWLFGPYGKNFVNTMRRLMVEHQEVRVVDDQHGSPTYTRDLAAELMDLADKPAGVYHRTNSASTTWHGLAEAVKEELDLSATVIAVRSDEFPRQAKRPKYSILQNTKLGPMRHWREALRDYLRNS